MCTFAAQLAEFLLFHLFRQLLNEHQAFEYTVTWAVHIIEL